MPLALPVKWLAWQPSWPRVREAELLEIPCESIAIENLLARPRRSEAKAAALAAMPAKRMNMRAAQWTFSFAST
jgi:hypothetical protein